ncbi:MAG: Hpt domain-containing protein [Sulfurospirillum sp.]|nr:Hpt domain-containing protein [Sulfurospirillum sp.]
MEDIQEILEDFLVEAFELIEQLDQNLVELESNPDDLELLNSIFRVAHTIKGSSSFLNFDVLTGLTHHMEDVLNKARHGEVKLSHEVMDVVLESIDMMKSLLHAIRDNGNDTSIGIDITDICRHLDIISNGDEVSAPVAPAQMDPVETPMDEDNVDYSKLSDKEVEEEIERLLKMRKEEDRQRKSQATVSTPVSTNAASSVQEDKNEEEEPKSCGSKCQTSCT